MAPFRLDEEALHRVDVSLSTLPGEMKNYDWPPDFGGSIFFALTHAGGKGARKLPRRAAFL
jgi:hypothetical protein